MIIWSRWGILVLPFFAIGVGLGFTFARLFGNQTESGPSVAVFIGLGMILSAVAMHFVLDQLVLRRLDKPRPAFFTQALPEPFVHPNGMRQTYQQLPILNPQTGEQVWTQPVSTFFFVPVRYWPFVLGAIGATIALIGVVGVLVGSS